MGTLVHGSIAVDFEDRLLAHLQIVIVQRFRRNEPLVMSWLDSLAIGDGRPRLEGDHGIRPLDESRRARIGIAGPGFERHGLGLPDERQDESGVVVDRVALRAEGFLDPRAQRRIASGGRRGWDGRRRSTRFARARLGAVGGGGELDAEHRLARQGRAIARVDSPELKGGEIWLDHQPLHSMRAFQAARAGVALVPEDRRIVAGLTVEENLRLAQIAPPAGWSIDRIYALFPRLGERRAQEGVTLSGGEQQMLAIGRALARDVKLLLLDEPFEGLAPVIVQEIERTLAEIRSLGITTIIVEQNAIAALHLADRAIILDMGQVAFDGTATEVLENTSLRHEYLAL